MKQPNPLDDVRWVCTACNTVNAIDDTICSGCKKSKPTDPNSPMAATEYVALTDDALRDLWRKHGGKFHGPNVKMAEADLFPFLRSLITGDPIATRADGRIIDEREVKSERDRFENWVQCYHADSWPNPDSSGGRTNANGQYWNTGLQQRWEAWQAAQDPREVADRAQRIEFAATALRVCERRRDELKEHLLKAKETLDEQPKFVAVRGCKPGDVVFLIPGRELSLQQVTQITAALKHFSEETGIKIGLLPTGFTVSARDAEPNDTATPAPRSPRAFDPSGQDGGESR